MNSMYASIFQYVLHYYLGVFKIFIVKMSISVAYILADQIIGTPLTLMYNSSLHVNLIAITSFVIWPPLLLVYDCTKGGRMTNANFI